MEKNPPTPALAKAGAAPGTTAGVEPSIPIACLCQLAALPFASRHNPAAPTSHFGRSMLFSPALVAVLQGCLWPGFKSLLQTLKTVPCSSHAPLGRSILFLLAFKAAVCQASKREQA